MNMNGNKQKVEDLFTHCRAILVDSCIDPEEWSKVVAMGVGAYRGEHNERHVYMPMDIDQFLIRFSAVADQFKFVPGAAGAVRHKDTGLDPVSYIIRLMGRESERLTKAQCLGMSDYQINLLIAGADGHNELFHEYKDRMIAAGVKPKWNPE